MVRINQSRRYFKPVNGITLSKSLVTYTIAESGITGDTTNIYSLIVWDPTDATDKTVTISGEECLGINQTASKAIWRIDGVAQSGRTGTVDCDNELHNIQFNGR